MRFILCVFCLSLFLCGDVFAGTKDEKTLAIERDVESYLAIQKSLKLTLFTNFSPALDPDEIWAPIDSYTKLVHFGIGNLILREGRVSDETEFSRGLRFLSASFASFVFEAPVMVAGHEYGHFRASSRIGAHDYIFVKHADPNDQFAGNPWSAFVFGAKRVTSFWGRHKYGAGVSNESDRDINRRLGSNYMWYDIAKEVAGINQQEYHTRKLGEEVLSGNGHTLDVFTYTANTISFLLYPSRENADPDDYVRKARKAGIDVSLFQTKVLSSLPKLFLSNSSITLWRNAWRYILGKERVDPISFSVSNARVYWPDFESLLTYKHGLVLGARVRIEYGTHRFHANIRRSVSDDNFELGVEWRGRLHKNVVVHGRFFYNEAGGTWTEIGVSVLVVSSNSIQISFFGSVSYGSGYTIERDVFGSSYDFVTSNELNKKIGFQITKRF